MGTAAFLLMAVLLAITFGLIRIWNAGVQYGDAKRLQEFKAHAMVADELHRRRLERKAEQARSAEDVQ